MSRSAHGGAAPVPFFVGLLALLVAACAGLPSAATPESPVTAPPPPAPSAAADPTPRASAAASPTSAAELLPIAGVWRVRKTLSAEDQSGLITDPAFDEETYSVEAGCPDEPCDRLEVTTTPLGLTSPATVIQLSREGANGWRGFFVIGGLLPLVRRQPGRWRCECHLDPGTLDRDRAAGRDIGRLDRPPGRPRG